MVVTEQGLQTEGPAGNARARLMRARDVVAVACAHLARDPLVFLCPAEAHCAECDAARASAGGSRRAAP
jgi:aminoglycoside 3-N-acetyltransferase